MALTPFARSKVIVARQWLDDVLAVLEHVDGPGQHPTDSEQLQLDAARAGAAAALQRVQTLLAEHELTV